MSTPANPDDYYSQEDWNRLMTEAKKHPTPFLLMDLPRLRTKFQEYLRLFPRAKIYYAYKANPLPGVLETLRDLGCYFDLASIYELDELLAAGVSPDRLSYGNTIKKASDIEYAWNHGIRLFVTDSLSDVQNIGRYAPGSEVLFRMLTEGVETAEWPLSRKFGCHPDMIFREILLAEELGLKPTGISFHVGSQQRDVGMWDAAIVKVSHLFEQMLLHGVSLRRINLGGGFPAHYITRTNPLETYAETIYRSLRHNFGNEIPEIMLEPGRGLVGNAGLLVSEVINVAQKTRHSVDQWIFTDVGVYGGLIETLGESIKYPVWSSAKGESSENFILAGPTCDSIDVLYETYRVPLPSEIKAGDRLYWFNAGAYTASCSAVNFNGFPPLSVHYLR